jgi:hypothetical protein
MDFVCRLTLQVAQTLGHLGLCKKSRRLADSALEVGEDPRKNKLKTEASFDLQEMGSGAEKSFGHFVRTGLISLINVVVVCRWNWG